MRGASSASPTGRPCPTTLTTTCSTALRRRSEPALPRTSRVAPHAGERLLLAGGQPSREAAAVERGVEARLGARTRLLAHDLGESGHGLGAPRTAVCAHALEQP